MGRTVAPGFILGLLLAPMAMQPAAIGSPPTKPQEITSAPRGPFHIEGNRIVDANAHPFLIRGTQVAPFRLDTAAHESRSGVDFGSHSATSLAAIRLRFNMNAVRIPVDVDDSSAGYFGQLAEVVRRANGYDLLAILAADGPGHLEFWSQCAAFFKDYPNLMFAPPADAVAAMREAGAHQPVLVPQLIGDRNSVYEISPRYDTTRTDVDRDRLMGSIASRMPVMANDWDLKLDDAAQCAAIPKDPAEAAQLVRANLAYFDAHRISWTVSVFEPGKLVKDLAYHDATTIEDGWTCGKLGYPAAGMGRIIEAHLRGADERGLFVVGAAGGIDIARGGFAIAYGPVMAERDAYNGGSINHRSLAGIQIQVTDSQGVARIAPVHATSAGWGQTNFVIPEESATGPATMTIVRNDGSRLSANITIADTAPGIWTRVSCRGPALGQATQTLANGRRSTFEISGCQGPDCRALPIPVSVGATTQVRLKASGLRYAGSTGRIEALLGGTRVKVVSFGPAVEPGTDQLTIEIPSALRGLGETDLVCSVGGRISNPVRLNIGGKKPVS